MWVWSLSTAWLITASWAPKNLPKKVVDKISAGVKKALQEPGVTKRINDTGSLVIANTPEEFTAQIKAEFEVYKKSWTSQKLKLD